MSTRAPSFDIQNHLSCRFCRTSNFRHHRTAFRNQFWFFFQKFWVDFWVKKIQLEKDDFSARLTNAFLTGVGLCSVFYCYFIRYSSHLQATLWGLFGECAIFSAYTFLKYFFFNFKPFFYWIIALEVAFPVGMEMIYHHSSSLGIQLCLSLEMRFEINVKFYRNKYHYKHDRIFISLIFLSWYHCDLPEYRKSCTSSRMGRIFLPHFPTVVDKDCYSWL